MSSRDQLFKRPYSAEPRQFTPIDTKLLMDSTLGALIIPSFLFYDPYVFVVDCGLDGHTTALQLVHWDIKGV